MAKQTGVGNHLPVAMATLNDKWRPRGGDMGVTWTWHEQELGGWFSGRLGRREGCDRVAGEVAVRLPPEPVDGDSGKVDFWPAAALRV